MQRLIPLQAAISNQVLKLSAIMGREELAKAELDVIQKRGKEKRDAELKLLELQKKKELENKELTESEKLLIEEKYREKRQDAEMDHLIKLGNAIADWGSQVANAFNLFSDIRTNKENAELARDKAINDKKKKNLDGMLKAGLISQIEYDRQIQKLEKQQEEREKAARLKQFKRDQRAQMVAAGIDGLRGVTKTLSEFGPPIPPNFAGMAAMALTILTTALTVKAIASKEPPSFGRGGKTSGYSHSRGGMGVYDHLGRKQAELEGDEGIINKFSMRDSSRYTVTGTPSQIASAINARHGGVQWDSGAALQPAWKTIRPVPMNFSVIKKAYADGGVFQKPAGQNEAPSNVSLDAMAGVLVILSQAVENLNGQLAAGITAKTYLTDQEAQQDRIDRIRNDATFKA